MEIFRDKAGNRIVKNFDGTYEGQNARGQRVNRKDFETLMKRAGHPGSKRVGTSKRGNDVYKVSSGFDSIF